MQAKNMYQNATTFTSDLMNSYAWDTATLFLQTCGKDKYSRKTSVNTSLSQTGTTEDKQCNVFDMASNVYEWSTETANDSNYPCVCRGGRYRNSSNYTNLRDNASTSNIYDFLGFRPLLFIGLNS